MRTSSIFIFAIVFGIFTICIPTAHASGGLLITEIMYDVPGANTGREWVEVMNGSTSPIDLGAKTIRLGDISGSHLIKEYQNGGNSGTIIQPQEVAVIAQNPDAFLVDWPAYSGLLLKSSFSLPANSTGMVSIMDSGTVLSKVTYTPTQGAHNDGNSLQRKGDVFVPGSPTPGTYPLVPPAAMRVAPKLSIANSSSNNQAGQASHAAKSTSKRKKAKKSSTSSKSHSAYGKGTTAPATSAEADVAGALPISFAFLGQYKPVLSTPWFAWFIALLAFSAFSLIVLDIHGRTPKTV
jgi:hypothetical protein